MTIFKRAAAATGFTIQDLIAIVRNAPRRYKVFEIPKKTPGEMRQIAQPARELKLIQRWLVEEELAFLPVHERATAYVKGSGIRRNASFHVQNSFILKMDFADFFPSLVPVDLFAHLDQFDEVEYSDEDRDFLARMLFWAPPKKRRLRLSIGAPSSPFISNTILFQFDLAIADICREREVEYSRYADDLTFSTNQKDVLVEIQASVAQTVGEIEYPRDLAIKEQKTIYVSKKYKRQITGVVLSSQNKLSIGRDRKRQIRAAVHHFLTDRLSPEESEKLRGLLSFAKDIEPDFFDRLVGRYGADQLRRIQRYRRD